MLRFGLLFFCAGLFLAATLAHAAAAAPAARPNVIFILADDLGWHDLHVYGNAWHDTPNLDRLAQEGTRFTNAYAPAPICSASRAALLTGRSPARLGFEFVVKNRPAKPPTGHPLTPPPYPLNLPLSEITPGQLFSGAGYATGYYGKWHLNEHYQGYLGWSPVYGPLQRGFAEGNMEFGSHPYGDAKRPKADMADLPAGDYGRDALTELAIAFLREHRTGQPFFLQLSHYYVHEPIKSRARWLVDKYATRLPAGTSHDRAVYGAMVETLDHLVGQLLQALDELGLRDNTLIVFASDNGGHPLYSGNGPLRGNKWNVYEGGIRIPWIVRWPGHIPAGRTSDVPFIGTDLLPTLCAATGVPLPAGVTLDGIDVLPVWRGVSAGDPDRALVWHFPYYHPEEDFDKALPRIGIDDFSFNQTRPQSAIRVGDWGLLHFYEDDHDELYQLSADLSQQHDHAAADPARTRALRQRLDATLHAMGARFATPTAPAGKISP